MRVDLCLQSHISSVHFLFFCLCEFYHGILQIIAHKLKCLVKFLKFIDRDRIGSDLFLTKSVQLHSLNDMFQMLDRFDNRTGQPV